MGNNKTGWLNETPYLPAAGGPGSVWSPFTGRVALKDSELVHLYNLMISPTFIGLFVGLFADAKEWINRLLVFPFPIPCINIPKYLRYGPIDSGTLDKNPDTGEATACYQTTDIVAGGNELRSMGSTYIPRYFNNFMDYNGYTKIEVYLPFCGQVEVMPNDCVGKYLFVDLFIDYMTGKGMYYLSVGNSSNTDTIDRRIILTKECTLGYQIPIGGTNSNEALRNMVMGIVKTGATVAALGAMSSSTVASKGKTTITKTRYNKNKEVIGKTRVTKTSGRNSVKETGAGALTSMAIAGSMGALNGINMNVESDRVNNPLLDIAGPKSVKVVIKRPIPIPITENYNRIYGKPAGYTSALGELTGFTKISGIHLENFSSATSEELDMLDELLKAGVILDGYNKVIFPPDPTEGQLLQTVNNEYVLTSDNNYIELED